MKLFVPVIRFLVLVAPLLAAPDHEKAKSNTVSDNPRLISTLDELPHQDLTVVLKATEVKCQPATIEGFPRPRIDAKLRLRGGIAAHIGIAILMILIISVLCSEYFVPALHVLVHDLRIDPDVAGGTFMAASSSIPSLVTSIMGINVLQNDLGLSTTLGAGVLKAAGILSIAALFARRSVEIHAWPLLRSSFFFLLSMIIVLCSLIDNEITSVEATVCLVTYALYTLVMVLNRSIEKFFKRLLRVPVSEDLAKVQDTIASEVPNAQRSEMKSIPGEDKALARVDVTLVKPTEVVLDAGNRANDLPELSSDLKSWGNLVVPRKIFLILIAPFCSVLSLMIPNCKKPGNEKYCIVTFLLSGGLIAAFSYLLVWMMAITGHTFRIPDSVLGLIFLSISVTLPDVISSVLVVRKGYADMAISYVLGTIIFEMLVGLGLPWFLQTTIIKPGNSVKLQNASLIYSTAGVLVTVFLLPALTVATGWRMNKTYGLVLLSWYLTFMVVSSLHQLNVFDDSSPPSCGSDY